MARSVPVPAPEHPGILLVAPIAPDTPGNGLAHRVRIWRRALRRGGAVDVVLVPTHGPAVGGDHDLVPLVPPTRAAAGVPPRGARAPESLGRWWASGRSPIDLVVAIGVDVAPFALGASGVLGARTVVDLVDDDVAFHGARRDAALADAYRTLVDEARRRADLVVSVTGFDGTVAVPNAVDVAPPDRPTRSDRTQVLFVGSFGYAPNVEGARWLVEDVWPTVAAARPDATLAIVGPGSEGFGGLGLVEDLAPRYAAAAVVVVPLRHGSGTRIKALEAFAHGVPVVGTTIGLEGLGVVDGTHALVADDASGLAARVVEVLDDPAIGRRLAAAAGDLVLDRFDAAAVEAQVATLVREVLTRPRPVRWERGTDVRIVTAAGGALALDEGTGTGHRLTDLAAHVLAAATHPADRAALVAASASAVDPAALDHAIGFLAAAGLVRPVPVH